MSSELVLANPRFEDFTVELSDKDPPFLEELVEELRGEVFEQDEAIKKAAQRIMLIDAGLQRAPSPILFAGPSGTGKSYLTEIIARVWLGEPIYGEPDPLVSIAGENYMEKHTISSLLGAPAGYVGYGGGTSRAKSPLEDIGMFDAGRKLELIEDATEAWKENVSKKYTGEKREQFLDMMEPYVEDVIQARWAEFKPFRSVLRIDEFEKMHPDVQKQFLGIFNDGVLRLRSEGGRLIDFSGCLIILTSNIGAGEITKFIDTKPVGFQPPSDPGKAGEDTDQKIYELVKNKVKKELPPELYNRIGHDGIVVFRQLSKQGYEKIIEKEVEKVQSEFGIDNMETGVLMVYATDGFKEFILSEADAPREGARMIKRLIDKHMRLPLAKRISAEDLMSGDMALFTVENGEIKIRIIPRPDNMDFFAISGHSSEIDPKKLQQDVYKDLGRIFGRMLRNPPPVKEPEEDPVSPTDGDGDSDNDPDGDDGDIYDQDNN